MTSILIDFKIITANKLKLLADFLKPIPKTKTKLSLGLILIIGKKQKKILESKSGAREKINYINSSLFIQSIISYTFIIYDKKRKICVIKDNNLLFSIIELTQLYLPNDILLWVSLDLNDPKIKTIIENGFYNPYISNKNPLGEKLPCYQLCMTKQNDVTDYDKENVNNNVKYVLEQFKHNPCQLSVKLNEKAINYLRALCGRGSSINSNGAITQKELAGTLQVENIDSNFIHTLGINRDSIITGKEEGVEVVKGLFNFHSHPQSAYKRHGVKLAWPSAQDYIGFLLAALEDNTIFHMVISIEGIYIMSFGSFWAERKNKLQKKAATFILENYDFCYKSGLTPNWYIKKVNGIIFEKAPLFTVQFLPWHEANKIFTVSYNKFDKNCFSNDNTYNTYTKFFNLNK